MKTIITALFAMAVTAAVAQTKVSLSGTASEGAKTVYFYDGFDTRFPTDSVGVNDGRWHYESALPAGQYFLTVGDDCLRASADGVPAAVMADGVATTVDLAGGVVNGSKASVALNDAFRTLMQLVKEQKTPDGEEKMVVTMRNAVMDNLDSMLPVAFVPLIADALSVADLQTILRPTAPYYGLPTMASARERLDLLSGNSVRSIGKTFTDMAMADAEGVEHRLSEWCGKGRYVLIDFWASWCGPCRAEMPNVVECYEKYHDRGLDVIGISFDQNKDAWLKAVKSLNMPWVHLSDLKGWKSLGAQTYAIRSIPANILLDGEGKIIDVDLRGAMLGARLAQLLP